MILIFSDTSDAHADAVQKALTSKGVAVLRLNRDELQSWGLNCSNGDILLTHQDKVYSADKVRSIFIRRLPDLEFHKRLVVGTDDAMRDYIALQFFVLTNECIAVLSESKPTINTLSSANRAQAKASQLFVAKKLGLRIPLTYSGAHPRLAAIHLQDIVERSGRACSKPIVNSFVTIEGAADQIH